MKKYNFKANDKVTINYSDDNKIWTVLEADYGDYTCSVSDKDGRTCWEEMSDLTLYVTPTFPSIYVHRVGCGRTVKACYMDGDKVLRKAKATCHKDDEFDYGVGANLALNRLFHKIEDDKIKDKEIKVGDIVKIVEKGMNYSNYIKWFVNNNLINLGLRYGYNQNSTDINKASKSFKVVAIAPHCSKDKVLCAISTCDKKIGTIYLVDIEALEKIDN